MADNVNDNINDIDIVTMVEQLKKLLNSMNTENMKDYADKREKVEEKIQNRQLKNLLGTWDKVDQYKTNLEKKNAREKQKKDLQAEIKRIQEVNQLNDKNFQKQQEKLNKYLKQQRDALKEGDIAGAKRAERKIEEQKQLVQLQNKFEELMDTPLFKVKSPKQLGMELTMNLRQSLDKTITNLSNMVKQGLNQIDKAISSYAKYQTAINTRLQGTSSFSTATDALSGVAFSGLVSAEDLYSNLNTLVADGIATNVEQRAFFMTVKDGIATTFDANSAALKKIIRIQQEDSTAARLGMESYLTRFLNEFTESTEYLTSTFDSVAESLLQASALMASSDATEFEYIVQKWLGTLTGVGLSENSAQMIASSIAKLGSGDVSLFNEGAGSLVALGANKVGVDITNALMNGIDASETNNLLLGITQVLQEYGSGNNNVVKSQLASIFGLSITDLQAISKNLADTDLQAVYNSMMSYNDMYTELANQFNTMGSRMGIANVLENLMSNFTYQTGMNIASNAALYATWKVTDLISDVTGGINIPSIMALGTGVDLNTTVENLIKTGIVGVSTLGAIGDIVNGLGSLGSGSLLLEAIGLEQGSKVARGTGLSDYTIDSSGRRVRVAGSTVSQSLNTIGNAEGGDYEAGALNKAEQETNQALNDELNEAGPTITEYLDDVDFKTRLVTITEDIHDLRESGIHVKNMLTSSDITTGIAGFSLTPQTNS